MKVTIVSAGGAGEGEGVILTDVQEVVIGPDAREFTVIRADESFLYELGGEVLSATITPEPMNTKLLSEANILLATLPNCERCRSGDVLQPVCSCTKWCGVDACLADESFFTDPGNPPQVPEFPF